MTAQKEELIEVHKRQVYIKVLVQQFYDRTGEKPVRPLWVDINKRDDKKQYYRSRVVTQGFNDHKREDLFAATPIKS